jgi:broad specificity phosphatase PhoE
MKIYLVRHGETASNASRVVQTPDTPLSDRGIEQAARLAARLGREQIGSILCSTLRRATMTAEHLSSVANVPLTLRADLQERNYGDIRGIAYEELGVSILDPDYEPPGGETWREFHQRVAGVWRHIERLILDTSPNSPEAIVVVTHGLVLHALVSRHFDVAHLDGIPHSFANTSVTVVDPKPPWRVAMLNCTSHLSDTPLSEAC